jgi:hypothetical protein
MAAYAETMEPETKYGNCYCGQWHVVVRNLRTGHIVHRPPTGGSKRTPATQEYKVPEPGDYVGVGPAIDIVVRSDGSVAWIAQNYGLDKTAAGYEVHVLDRLGSRVLASSPEIKPSSLALRGGTLYWKDGGKPMSSHLD